MPGVSILPPVEEAERLHRESSDPLNGWSPPPPRRIPDATANDERMDLVRRLLFHANGEGRSDNEPIANLLAEAAQMIAGDLPPETRQFLRGYAEAMGVKDFCKRT